MLDTAINTLKPDEHPLVHSDRGCHYRWPGWIERMENAGLTRSMSKKGCSPDNSACEGFFGRLKNEMFYNRKWDGVSIEEFIGILDTYIHWYAESRIKMSLGGLSTTARSSRFSYTVTQPSLTSTPMMLWQRLHSTSELIAAGKSKGCRNHKIWNPHSPFSFTGCDWQTLDAIDVNSLKKQIYYVHRNTFDLEYI